MKFLISLIILMGLITTSFLILKNINIIVDKEIEKKTNYQELNITPEVSGWIAWWKEEEAYNMIQKYPSKFKSISPVWFFINSNLDLVDKGRVDKVRVINDMKNYGISVLPSLGSELNAEEFGQFLNSQQKIDSLIDNFVNQLTSLGADGADIDLEGIKKEDKDAFSQFLLKLSEKFNNNNLELVVTVHAQTEKVEWEGVLGQDLKRIGEVADYVRVMAYDKHSASTGPGAISPINWIKDVAIYNSRFIDKDKIVIGVPSYSYVWTEDGCEGMQFDELNKYLKGKKYTQKRDNESKELVFQSDKFSAWLSDSESIIEKIESLRRIGFNKFVIWHLGGMDEKLFEKSW